MLTEMADLRNDKNFKTLTEVDEKGNINLGELAFYFLAKNIFSLW